MSYLENYKHWLASAELSPEEKKRLEDLSADKKLLEEMFVGPLEFGTAGMRGVLDLGPNRMNAYSVRRATKGLADYISSLGEGAKARGVVISYDTRRFSSSFACAAAKVLAAAGIKVFIMEDVRPVPICSFAIRRLNAAAGIMITASHNPKQYNGYKVYGDDGAQMSPEATAGVVEFISRCDYFGISEADVKLDAETIKDKDNFQINNLITVCGKSLDEAYFAEIEKLSLSPEAVKKVGKDIKIVYTPIHGSGYMPVTAILARMGITVSTVPEQAKPDPDFSTVPVPNPEDPAALNMAVALADKIGADLVIGTDPDCDRMGVAVRSDEGKFVLLTGNQTGAMLTDYVLSKNALNGTLPKNPAVVKTIVTTDLTNAIAASYGAKVFDVLTGFKYIGEKIKEWEATGEYTFMFGFEESYGYLAGTHARDKDAVVASMLFAEMACYLESQRQSVYGNLQRLFETYGCYTEKSISVVYGGLDGMTKMSAIMKKLRAYTFTRVADEPVLAVSDLASGIKSYLDGKLESIDLPSADAIKIHLENGDWACVRPSGTEPKLKIYVSAKGSTLEKSQQTAKDYLDFLKPLCE